MCSSPNHCGVFKKIKFINMAVLLMVIHLAETEPHEGKRKVEALWPIFRIHHQKSRYIYDLFYKRRAISRGEMSHMSMCIVDLIA
jgi:G10 protein